MGRPPGAWLVPELAHLPATAELPEATALGQCLDRGVRLGHDRVAHALAVEKLDHPFAEKARVAADPDTGPRNAPGHLGQTDPEERDGARGRHRVPRP